MAKNRSENVNSADGLDFEEAQIPEGSIDVGRDWPMYKPEQCKMKAIYGHLIDRVEMPPTENGDWEVAIVRLLAPTLAVERDDTVRVVGVGELIALPLTAANRDLNRFAAHPEKIFALYIKPKAKVPLGKGKTMWTYDSRVDPSKTYARGDLLVSSPLPQYNGHVQALPAASARALPAAGAGYHPVNGRTAPSVQQGSSEEVPF